MSKKRAPTTVRRDRRQRARLGAILVAAATEMIYAHPARAGAEVASADNWGPLPGRGTVMMADLDIHAPDLTAPTEVVDVRRPSASDDPPAVPQMQLAASIDHINVPSPEVSRAEAAMAADAHTIGPISRALHSYQLTPAQLVSVRNYIGQYDEHTKVTAGLTIKGVSTFAIQDAKSGD